jgi:hypothetical protein
VKLSFLFPFGFLRFVLGQRTACPLDHYKTLLKTYFYLFQDDNGLFVCTKLPLDYISQLLTQQIFI